MTSVLDSAWPGLIRLSLLVLDSGMADLIRLRLVLSLDSELADVIRIGLSWLGLAWLNYWS